MAGIIPGAKSGGCGGCDTFMPVGPASPLVQIPVGFRIRRTRRRTSRAKVPIHPTQSRRRIGHFLHNRSVEYRIKICFQAHGTVHRNRHRVLGTGNITDPLPKRIAFVSGRRHLHGCSRRIGTGYRGHCSRRPARATTIPAAYAASIRCYTIHTHGKTKQFHIAETTHPTRSAICIPAVHCKDRVCSGGCFQ